ncbi:hypothetical protein RhiirA5_381315 [Rhizophagus irregularis]|uniref:Uncharacterized protein n=1 Tax=Rhizophagus irregularis TaxID=588596 RepID=A0A2N0P563_9GLOM|nr:hypothetical protein RhiirA5_381315 [Rhizophagus irregularis]
MIEKYLLIGGVTRKEENFRKITKIRQEKRERKERQKGRSEDQTQGDNTTTVDTSMEEVANTSSTHDLSHSEIDVTSRDSQEKDVHTQTPITEKLTNMDVDPIESNNYKRL